MEVVQAQEPELVEDANAAGEDSEAGSATAKQEDEVEDWYVVPTPEEDHEMVEEARRAEQEEQDKLYSQLDSVAPREDDPDEDDEEELEPDAELEPEAGAGAAPTPPAQAATSMFGSFDDDLIDYLSPEDEA